MNYSIKKTELVKLAQARALQCARYDANFLAENNAPAPRNPKNHPGFANIQWVNGKTIFAAFPLGKLAEWAKLLPNSKGESDRQIGIEFSDSGKLHFLSDGACISFFIRDTVPGEILSAQLRVKRDCPREWLGEAITVKAPECGGEFHVDMPDAGGIDAKQIKKQLAASRKAIKADTGRTAALNLEQTAKKSLLARVRAHCQDLETVAGGIQAAKARAWLIVRALRLYRAALRNPTAPAAWLDGGETLCVTHGNLVFDLQHGQRNLAEYKPRMITPRWGGAPAPKYGPKFDALQTQVKNAETALKDWIKVTFEAECVKNGLPESLTWKFRQLASREFSRARLAEKRWLAEKAVLALDYVNAINDRRELEAESIKCGVMVRAKAVHTDGRHAGAVLTVDRLEENKKRAREAGARVFILESNIAGAPVGECDLRDPAPTVPTVPIVPESAPEFVSKYTTIHSPKTSVLNSGISDWYLLKEGEIVRCAGSLEHCEGWKRRLDARRAALPGEFEVNGEFFASFTAACEYARHESGNHEGTEYAVKNDSGAIVGAFYAGRRIYTEDQPADKAVEPATPADVPEFAAEGI